MSNNKAATDNKTVGNKKSITIIVMALVVLICGSLVLYRLLGDEVDIFNFGKTDETLAPDFTVYDVDGNPTKLSELRGKPVVLNFWASWCRSCDSEMHDFQDLYDELGDEVHFAMVNVTTSTKETFNKAKALIETQGYTFPVYYDTEGSAAVAYGIDSLPTTYIIDAEGYLAAWASGPTDEAGIRKGIELAQEQVK